MKPQVVVEKLMSIKPTQLPLGISGAQNTESAVLQDLRRQAVKLDYLCKQSVVKTDDILAVCKSLIGLVTLLQSIGTLSKEAAMELAVGLEATYS